MNNEIKNETTMTTESNNTSNKGNKLNIKNCYRLLELKEKKEKYTLLAIGEFKDVIFTHDETGYKISNLPKRFRGSYGFNCGYLGSGPTDFALSLLLHFSNQDLEFTHKYYHDLLEDLVQHLPLDQDIVISANELLDWVSKKRCELPRFETTYRPIPCEPDHYYNHNNYAELRSELKEKQTDPDHD